MDFEAVSFSASEPRCVASDLGLNACFQRVGYLYKYWGGQIMKAFIEGFLAGAKATPRGYFAPAVALWRLLVSTTESLLEEKAGGRSAHVRDDQPCGR